jgi:zinc/manganese transport system ATP-binding protein
MPQAPPPDTILTFTDLTLGYNSHPAVHHLSGSLGRGDLLAVVGANGSGKSTLLKGIAGILKPMGGAIRSAPGLRIAYLPQQSELDRSFPADVRDLVSLGLWPRRGLLQRLSADDRKAVAAALAAVGLDGFGRRGIATLSGGQLQRALFARVILQDADLILLDEPFNAVDQRTVTALLELIRLWHAEKRTVIVVAHDLALVRDVFPQALLLARRPVAWGDARRVLSTENLLGAGRFTEAWDEEAPWCEAAEGHHGHAHAHGDEHRPAAQRGAA